MFESRTLINAIYIKLQFNSHLFFTLFCCLFFLIPAELRAENFAHKLISGQYEQLAIAVDNAGNLTGYYHEDQGEAPTKSCSFFLIGKSTTEGGSIISWSNIVLTGSIALETDGLVLKIPHGRHHHGCGLVLLPQIDEGISLSLIEKKPWSEIRTISDEKVYFYSDGNHHKKLKSYLIKGNIVGIIDKQNYWLEVEFNGINKISKGWIPEQSALPLKPTNGP